MRAAVIATFVVLGIAISSAFSNDAPPPAKPDSLEEQVTSLIEKLEKLEKRLAALEEDNQELRAAIKKPRIRVIQAPPERKEDQPKFRLLDHTELGVPFSVERAMLGDAHQQEFQLRQFVPQQLYEYKIEPQALPIPEFRLNPEP